MAAETQDERQIDGATERKGDGVITSRTCVTEMLLLDPASRSGCWALVLHIPFIPPNPSREWNKQQEIVTLRTLARVSHTA